MLERPTNLVKGGRNVDSRQRNPNRVDPKQYQESDEPCVLAVLHRGSTSEQGRKRTERVAAQIAGADRCQRKTNRRQSEKELQETKLRPGDVHSGSIVAHRLGRGEGSTKSRLSVCDQTVRSIPVTPYATLFRPATWIIRHNLVEVRFIYPARTQHAAQVSELHAVFPLRSCPLACASSLYSRH